MKFNWTWIPGVFLASFSVIGNSLVIFLISTRRNIRTTTNRFVLLLAVADLGVAVAWYPVLAFCTKAPDQKGCTVPTLRIASILVSMFVFASVTNLCALTMDRYLAIVHPLRYVTFMTKKRVALLVSAAWTVPSSVLVSSALVHVFASEKVQKVTFAIVIMFFGFGLITAGVFLLFATVRIFLVVRRIVRQNAAVVAQLSFNHKLQHGVAFKVPETASAKMIGIVVTVYLVCYLWYILHVITFIAGSPFPQSVSDMATLLVIFNSAANPVAYAFHKREIKRELRRLFRRLNRRQHVSANSGAREEQGECHQFRLSTRTTVPSLWGYWNRCSVCLSKKPLGCLRITNSRNIETEARPGMTAKRRSKFNSVRPSFRMKKRNIALSIQPWPML